MVVNDVRDLIDVLATEGAEAPTRSTPTICDIPGLIASLHYTKAAIRLRIDGELDTVPDHLGLTAHRIAQESLTNALKHAEGAPVTVQITIDGQAVGLMILNTATPARANGSTTGGYGIVGMHERVRALGGTLAAGTGRDHGGWRVDATLPRSRI